MLRTVMMMWTDRCRWRGNEGIDGLFVDIVATQERFEWKASEDVTMPRSNRSTGSWIKAWRSPHPRVPSLQNSICISFDQFSCRHTVVVAPSYTVVYQHPRPRRAYASWGHFTTFLVGTWRLDSTSVTNLRSIQGEALLKLFPCPKRAHLIISISMEYPHR